MIRQASVRNLFSLLVSATVLFFALDAGAIIDATLQMQLGNPSGATADPSNHGHYLIQRTVEAIDYNETNREPNWASWDLTASDIGSSGRSPDFYTDTNLPPGFYEVTSSDYSGSGFDRGHMCPSGDRTVSDADNALVFFMSNIIPQAPTNNQVVWANFESYCRSLTSGNEILIICGPSLFNGTRTASSGSVAIATYTWKIAVVVPLGAGTALSRITSATRVISLKIPNSNNVSSSWQNYITSASAIEVDTGYTFFTALSPAIASALRSKVDGQTNPAPVISSFSPTSGGANTNVVITGTGFTSAQTVTFNGLSATFTVNSGTQITATVPTNASSGQISVTTASGTAISSSSFTVTGAVATVDLAIVSTHVNNFTQGDTGDTYTIIVTNLGSLASTGSVTVTDALPASLTATAISGTGWTANLTNLTCTRSDALAPGAGYSPITIIVSVASNAPASVTNIAMLSGGGDANSANNTAADPTIINSSVVVTNTNTVTLVSWDTSNIVVSNIPNFGASPFPASTNAANLSVVGLTRGSGVTTSGTGASRGWGGTGFASTNAATAISSNQFVTFAVTASAGYTVSYSSISKFDYRHSGTGPTNGLLQYQIGSGAFTDIATVSYPLSTSAGASLSAINLSGISALQNVNPGTNVTFRIVNWGGGSSGTWYIYDVAGSTAPDFVVQGTLTPTTVTLTPIQSWRQQYFGTTNNSGTAADTAVASSDGMPNLLKYAFGLNPLVATNSPMTGDITTGYLRVTLPKNPNATDISFHVEVTGNLANAWATNNTTIDQNTATLLQVHDNTPINTAASSQFMRLRVSRP